MTLKDGFSRAPRAWPMTLLLTVFSALLAPALEARNRMAAADFGIGGFPFNIANRDYYQALGPAETATLWLLCLIWVFLAGGIIDRLARDTRSGPRRFFAACGACFGPLARLALIMLGVYWLLLTWLEPAMARAADTASETIRMTMFGGLAIIIFAIALVFDYARVRLVIEDRRSAIGALAASVRLIRAYPGRILAAQGIFWLVLVGWMWTRALVDPLSTSLAAQLLIAGEIFLKLGLIGTQCAIYQQVLASAGWVARADAQWPDEPRANPAAL